MEIQYGHLELSVISQVSAVEGCPLSGVPLYTIYSCYDGSLLIAKNTLNHCLLISKAY